MEERPLWATLGVISAGGILGSLARYGISTAFGPAPAGFAWATFLINVSGCLLIGALMAAITEVWQAHPLTRPFLGIGVLGGYTTFSTYAVDAQRAFQDGQARTALLYLGLTPACALIAVFAGTRATRRLTGRARS
ncbi:hypothetical protein GCM10010191_53280 [Actinomadura vinacea]|uniref:Fluoride-specific ion channel FluC n=1 Tax=Actinomadura vinacea TaxID=115336 RepID=A0ABN3JJV5_9ACTN